MAASETFIAVEVGEVLSQSNNGQGDCLFVVISEQLDGQISAPVLRQIAVEFLTAHRLEFQDDLLSLGWDMLETGEIGCHVEDDMLIDAVLQTLSNPWTWGGAECIAALGLHLNREVRVYQENGPTILFLPANEQEPSIRILLRYPRAGVQRRTHYESVLAWRANNPGFRSAAAVSVSTQTEDQSEMPRCPDAQMGQSEMPRCPDAQMDQSAMPRCPDAQMVLRPRGSLTLSASALRKADFSDEEEASAEVKENPMSKKFKLCLVCSKNIGKYVLVPCGAFPLCGKCINTCYVRIKCAPCPHCGKAVIGWRKVYNQH